MEGGRRLTTVRQLELLVDFLEGHRDLALGRVRSKEGRALSSWLWENARPYSTQRGPSETPRSGLAFGTTTKAECAIKWYRSRHVKRTLAVKLRIRRFIGQFGGMK